MRGGVHLLSRSCKVGNRHGVVALDGRIPGLHVCQYGTACKGYADAPLGYGLSRVDGYRGGRDSNRRYPILQRAGNILAPLLHLYAHRLYHRAQDGVNAILL